jgi:hypothetical protein
MAQKLTDKGSLGTTPESGDLFHIVDVSDTTSSPQGTSKKIAYSTLLNAGNANGLATLDGSGLLPVSQLPISAMEYKGTWNASTNTPTLADGVGNTGDVYNVSVAGTQDLGSGSITFAAGDWVIYSGTIWEKSINSNAVASVFTRTGAVTAQSGDYNAGQITNTPAGDIVATDVQAAINELDSDKEPTITAGTTAQYYRGDKTFQTLDKAAVGLNNVENLKVNLAATTRWINTSNDKEFVCADASVGAAVWKETTQTGGAVDSVFARTGAVTAQSGDYNASQITNTPAGNIAATNVQAAINELDSEKEPANPNIAKTNVAQEYTAQQNFDAVTLTDSTSINWDLNVAQVAKLTIGITIGTRNINNPTNMKDGGTYILKITHGSTPKTIVFGSAYKFPGGTAPVFSTGPNAVDIITFISDGVNMYGVAQYNFA